MEVPELKPCASPAATMPSAYFCGGGSSPRVGLNYTFRASMAFKCLRSRQTGNQVRTGTISGLRVYQLSCHFPDLKPTKQKDPFFRVV